MRCPSDWRKNGNAFQGGIMRKEIAVLLAGACLAATVGLANAQQLPKSGSIHFHTGWKVVGEALNAADKHALGHGSVVGSTFNDRGSGPLHLGPANCFYTFLAIEGQAKNKGSCAFGDPDGDRIFTDFTGVLGGPDGDQGTNQIVGGTGKYAGIQGSGPWKCKNSGSNGELQCAQRLDYRLP
jgi:hypothetical protein